MAKNVTAPFQFSLGELLGTVSMTFLGMLIFKQILPHLSELELLFVVSISTWVSALSTMDGSLAVRRRLWKLIDRIPLALICVYSFFWLLSQSGEVVLRLLAIAIICGFVALMILIASGYRHS